MRSGSSSSDAIEPVRINSERATLACGFCRCTPPACSHGPVCALEIERSHLALLRSCLAAASKEGQRLHWTTYPSLGRLGAGRPVVDLSKFMLGSPPMHIAGSSGGSAALGRAAEADAEVRYGLRRNAPQCG